ncbi:hypothetical protein QET93_010355 [Akkermansia sp. N21116]|uniref:hypothetical protein n=1 Tax=Akkermansia sp. N21116 TaxID=3040764 RepID=UPI00244EC82D|nr:hypothetical protein [Akkermansia sp. N21116]WPX39934.1 hypothetical protein QET93_010355 [Akkermansia sp. N21116]
MNRTTIPAALCAALFLASCSQEPKEAEKTVSTPVYVGKVDHVYKNYNYVLIRLFGAVPEAGTTLISQSPEGEASSRIANLVVTAERIGRLRVPADIRSGSVEEGDIVFRYQNLAEPESREQTSDDSKEKEVTPVTIPSDTTDTDAAHSGNEGIIGLPTYDPMPTKTPLPDSDADSSSASDNSSQQESSPEKQD